MSEHDRAMTLTITVGVGDTSAQTHQILAYQHEWLPIVLERRFRIKFMRKDRYVEALLSIADRAWASYTSATGVDGNASYPAANKRQISFSLINRTSWLMTSASNMSDTQLHT